MKIESKILGDQLPSDNDNLNKSVADFVPSPKHE
jgi:hypothetical protein